MADVFVSYARGDQSLAEKIAQHLIGAGFTTWWDSELLPHDSFANVIQQEILGARAVLVIWSEAGTRSQWVRAEAELARMEGKLIQVVADQCTIPLPFNQYQAADLRHWHGDAADPQWRKVLASVAHFVNSVAAGSSQSQKSSIRVRTAQVEHKRWRGRPLLVLTAAAVLTFAASGGALWWNSQRLPARGTRIAVQPFGTLGDAPELSNFAAGLSSSLQDVLTNDQLQTLSPTEAESLKGDDLATRSEALGVGLMFSGTVQAKGSDLDVSMRLDDPVQYATLWTAEISQSAAQADQLQARIGALTVAVLNCSAQGLAPGVGLSDGALQAFLHACELSETSDHGFSGGRSAYAMLDAMRQAVRVAPDFAAAHSVLAKHLAFVAAYNLPDQAASLRDEAKREAHRALALDPKDPDAFVALGLLVPPLEFAQREKLFRQALALNPSWPHANGFLGNVMTDVGRLQDAVTLYERAASVNPQSVDWSQEPAGVLIRIGQTEEADRELAQFAQLWPKNAENWLYQLDSRIAQKHWGDALKLLDRSGNFGSAISPEWVRDWRALLTALQSGDPAARNSLRQSLLASRDSNPVHAIKALDLLGFTDDALFVAEHMRIDISLEDSPSFLFDPETASLRRDPRFMVVAARFGLVDYWRSSGRWPDFCDEPGLPYDCRQEAAKFATQQTRR
ncbi:MAG: TIR domain-containing protein [Steroidobacteraceae bacterium]